MFKTSKVFVAGTNRLLRCALIRELDRQGYHVRIGETEQPDLNNAQALNSFFRTNKPDYVFYVGETSGGILANQRFPADLMTENILSQTHVIHESALAEVQKILFIGSSCCFPKHCKQPMEVESLLSGSLEPTSEAYATAKLAGMAMIKSYRQQYQVNGIIGIAGDVFGPDDHFDVERSHVIPALIHKMHHAKEQSAASVTVLGTGEPQREFMYSSDLASACIFIMNQYDGEVPINLGVNATCSIREIAHIIRDVVGYQGDLTFDTSKPDGIPIKSLDSSRLMEMGWTPSVPRVSALNQTYKGFLESLGERMSVSVSAS